MLIFLQDKTRYWVHFGAVLTFSTAPGGSIAVKNAPIFLLVRQVKLPKRLDLARDAEWALAAIPGSILAGWRQ